ncbi:MAG TPA: MoaD/ThiS family protein [Planctomycetota bacterium]|nr:MoaD/ThiS family protein [Planctomycetota bacterium]
MPVKVLIPKVLRSYTKDADSVDIAAPDVAGVINALETQYPGIGSRLRGKDGKVLKFVNIFVNKEDIRFLEEQKTALKDGDEVAIVPAVAGGR